MDSTDLSELRGWIDILREANTQKKRCEETITVARGKIEEALGDTEVGVLDDAPVVRWTHVTTTRFDAGKAKELLTAEQVAQCNITSEIRRFTLVEDSK